MSRLFDFTKIYYYGIYIKMACFSRRKSGGSSGNKSDIVLPVQDNHAMSVVKKDEEGEGAGQQRLTEEETTMTGNVCAG